MFITKAKASLILDQPFFASLLLSMPIIEDNSIPTIGVDGERIYYNREFMEKLTLPETVFLLAHETMHCVFQHMHRRGAKNHNKYNIAGDYIINDILVKEKVGVMPPGGCYDQALVKAGKETTEGVYNLLPDSAEQNGAGQPGGSFDVVMDAAQDEATMSQKEAEMRVKIVQAANAAKMCGKLSQGLERLVGELIVSKTDWKSVLRRFLSERAKTDLSYSKPKRRFLAEDIYLPSLTGEKCGGIVYAIDCSGSVNEHLLAIFSGEVNACVNDVKPANVNIVYFDSEVLKHDSFSPDDEIRVTPCGGGGTAFSPIFRYIESKGLSPVACIVLTDLCCSDFGEMPDYPVLWAATEKGQAPWGEIVMIQE
jgi:predicted metal-dependent peptidase